MSTIACWKQSGQPCPQPAAPACHTLRSAWNFTPELVRLASSTPQVLFEDTFWGNRDGMLSATSSAVLPINLLFTQFRAILFKPLGMANFITPFRENPDHCLSVAGALPQGLVYALDTDIVIKLPFQYLIQDEQDDDPGFYMDHALLSFVAMEKELAVHDAVAQRPHVNITRRLEAGPSTCLFLERLQPLERAWVNGNEMMRYRWVRQLLDAVSWLEELSYTHRDLAVRNLAVNSSDCLKLFDFGSATPTDHYDYAADVKETTLVYLPVSTLYSLELILLPTCTQRRRLGKSRANCWEAVAPSKLAPRSWLMLSKLAGPGRLHQPSFPSLRNVLRLSLVLRMRKMHRTLQWNITDA